MGSIPWPPPRGESGEKKESSTPLIHVSRIFPKRTQTNREGESVFLTIDLEPGVEYTAPDCRTNLRETFTVS